MKTTLKKKIDIRSVGIYAKTILLDYKPKSQEELATLISEHFNCICTTQDLQDYEQLYEHNKVIEHEDWELENRKQQYGIIY